VYEGTLNNCTMVGNSAQNGSGGAYGGTLNDCIVYYNIVPGWPFPSDWGGSSRLDYCCTTWTPLVAPGVGNITNAPLFVDTNGWSNLRLQSNSPCINAGLNAYNVGIWTYALGPTDLDGSPRIVSGTVDIGAYEFQGPGSVISYAWLQRYGLPIDGSVDYADPDSDGLNNWYEWLYGTDPTNALSTLRLLPPTTSLSGVKLSWQSITNHTYFLERSADLGASPTFLPLATGIPGLPPNMYGMPRVTGFTDSNAPSLGPCFYRVGIQP
jgi:hypothetical protein